MRTIPRRSVLLTVAVLSGGCDRNPTQPSYATRLVRAIERIANKFETKAP